MIGEWYKVGNDFFPIRAKVWFVGDEQMIRFTEPVSREEDLDEIENRLVPVFEVDSDK